MGTLKCSVFQQHINIFYIKIINIMATFEVNYTHSVQFVFCCCCYCNIENSQPITCPLSVREKQLLMTKYENNIKASVKNVIITVFFPTPNRFSIAYIIQPVNLVPHHLMAALFWQYLFLGGLCTVRKI